MKSNRLFFYFSLYWKKFVIIFLFQELIIILSLINPYITKLILDRAYPDKNLKLFISYIFSIGFIFLFMGLLRFFLNRISQNLKATIDFKLSNDLFKHLQNLDLNFYQKKSTGQYLYHFNNDIKLYVDFIVEVPVKLITLILNLILIILIIFKINSKIGIFCLFLFPINYTLNNFFKNVLNQIRRQQINILQEINKYICEVFNNFKLIKAFRKEEYEINRFINYLREKIKNQLKNDKIIRLFELLSSSINKILFGSIIFYGGYKISKEKFSLGNLSAIGIYLGQLFSIINQLNDLYKTFTLRETIISRLEDIFKIKSSLYQVNQSEYFIKEGKIEFRNVSFGYNGNLVFNNISFSLTSKNIGIVGKSGTGKTTLLFLILRLYQPEKGEILIDDIDINKISEDSFKKDVAIALEEPFLFNDTIANNIFYGLEEQNTEDRLIWAAKIAKVDDFVNKLKDKYNTNLGQSGIKLSKGQRQRISIARALIKKPKILLLDEATSSLDSDTEKNIIENLKKELKYATIILVSHRFSAIKEMEEILFLEDKDKIIKGKHKELIENYLPYQKFFYEQRIS